MQSILPFNSTPMERAAETAIREGMATAVATDTLWNAQSCPASLLPFLAWGLSIDDWDTNWSEAQKRDAIAAAVYIHRHKGTVGAMRRMMAALDFGLSLSEWFEHGGEPYTFRADIDATGRGLNQQALDDIYRAIEATKNARSYLAALWIYLRPNGPAHHAAGISRGLTVRLGAAA